MTLQINQKFKELLSPLTDEERKQLEESLLNEGCREAILTWRNQIVDGHNRYELCEKHGLQYRSNEMPFFDEDEALEWIYINQLGRRNLSDHQRREYIGRLYNLRKQTLGGTRKPNVQNAHLNTELKGNETTAQKIAKELGVSEMTVRRAGKIVEITDNDPQVKEKLFKGEITQKEVLESQNQEKEIMPIETDNLNETGKYHSTRIQNKVRELANAVSACQRAFNANGLKLSDVAPRLARLNYQSLEAQAKGLSKIKGK